MIRNNTVPINEENFTLTCEVTGPYDMIYWMKDNMTLNMNNSTSNETYYQTENNTLQFIPVTLYNDGMYQCVATNQAASHTSTPYQLLVNCECFHSNHFNCFLKKKVRFFFFFFNKHYTSNTIRYADAFQAAHAGLGNRRRQTDKSKFEHTQPKHTGIIITVR